MQTYQEMKDSGVSWLGTVPSGWTLQKLSRVSTRFSNGTTATQLDEETGYPVTRIQTISRGKIDMTKVGYISKLDANEKYLLTKNDILFSNINSLSMVGNVAIVDVEGLYHGMNLLRITPTRVNPRYFLYLLRSSNYQQYFSSIAKPAINQASIPASGIKATQIALPSNVEQQRIADYLDKETVIIDILIAKQVRLLELLEEKRLATITHVVTRGLVSSAPLKETEIKWLDKVPDHWGLYRAKYLFRKSQEKPFETDEVVTAFRDGEVVLRRLRRTEGFTFADKEIGYQHVNTGDLVIHAMDGFAGAIGVSKSNGKMSPVCTICKPINAEQVNTEYFAQLVRSMAKSDWLTAIAKGIRERSTDFRWSDFANMEFPLPTYEEQEAIVTFIKNEEAKVCELKEKVLEKVSLLKERRASLISNVTTGKVKV